jgi:hypothetical protein
MTGTEPLSTQPADGACLSQNAHPITSTFTAGADR